MSKLWCETCGCSGLACICPIVWKRLAETPVSTPSERFDVTDVVTPSNVTTRIIAQDEYRLLAGVLDEALQQAQGGKGIERHAGNGERFEDQQIVQLGEWMGSSTVFAIGQACKKSIESTRLPDDRARAELLGAINYLAAAVLIIDRRSKG